MSEHPHSRSHAHAHDHDHGHDSGSRLRWALVLTGAFMLVEVVGGIWSGSLALLADAGHMLTDTLALALALWAQVQSRRPPDALRSYGYHRMPVLIAFVNGLALLVMVVLITVEAVRRFFEPPQILGGIMLVVAVAGLLVNAVVAAVLHGGHQHDLNVRGALLHVIGDLLGSAAAIVAAIVILTTGWMPVDPLLSVLVALLILRSAWNLVRESAHILLEGTPDGFDVSRFEHGLLADVHGVTGVHHVHHWMLTPERSLMTLHAVVEQAVDEDDAVYRIREWVHGHYSVRHVTVQVERRECADHGGA